MKRGLTGGYGAGARLVLFVAAAICVFAGRDAVAEELIHGQGRLWHVQGGGAAHSYIFGTMHVTDWRVNDLPEEVEAAFKRSNVLVVESADPWSWWEHGRSTELGPHRSLASIVGNRMFLSMQKKARPYGVPSTILNGMRPWVAEGLFSIPVSEYSRRNAGVLVLDHALTKRAREAGKRIEGLESAADQIKAIVAPSEADQVASLRLALERHGEVERHFEELVQLYLAGDLDGIRETWLNEYAGGDTRLFAASHDPLVVVRNRDMVDALVEHLDRGGAFIAVGAAHLAGEEGILHLLEKRGYQVDRVL